MVLGVRWLALLLLPLLVPIMAAAQSLPEDPRIHVEVPAGWTEDTQTERSLTPPPISSATAPDPTLQEIRVYVAPGGAANGLLQISRVRFSRRHEESADQIARLDADAEAEIEVWGRRVDGSEVESDREVRATSQYDAHGARILLGRQWVPTAGAIHGLLVECRGPCDDAVRTARFDVPGAVAIEHELWLIRAGRTLTFAMLGVMAAAYLGRYLRRRRKTAVPPARARKPAEPPNPE